MRPVLAMKAIGFTILMPGIVAVLAPHALLGGEGLRRMAEARGVFAAGWLLLAAGAFVALGCVWEFAARGEGTPAPIDPPRKLVISGFYRYTRNPMYVGVASVLVAEAVLARSAWLGLYAAAICTCFHVFTVFYEEPKLRRTFGAEYEAYCGRVPRWLLPKRR